MRLIALAILVIYSNNLIRALRWAVFLRPAYKQSALPPTPWYRLIGSQFIGFTGLAIFGRIGELIRPLLIARRTGLTFPSQVAVVTVERVFDLGAFGLIFALNLLLSPQLQTLPYLHKAGYTIGALTLVIAVFVAGVRLAGELMARLTQGLVGLISKPAGALAAEKILAFRDGLNVIDSFADLLLAIGLSLLLWAVIALAYLITLKAFPAPVHDLTAGHTIVLMGFSIAGSASADSGRRRSVGRQRVRAHQPVPGARRARRQRRSAGLAGHLYVDHSRGPDLREGRRYLARTGRTPQRSRGVGDRGSIVRRAPAARIVIPDEMPLLWIRSGPRR